MPTKTIKPSNKDSHQVSPHWVVTFIPVEGVNNPIVVQSDCISINVQHSKSNPSPQATMVFTPGNLNYMAIAKPGDFVIVNMVNWGEKAKAIAERAAVGSPINMAEDGFKGIFRVSSTNKIYSVDPNSGSQTIRYQITAHGFSEFNTLIYYNPTLANSIDQLLLLYHIGGSLFNVLLSNANVSVVLRQLYNMILGPSGGGGGATVQQKKKAYRIPQVVFRLLNLTGNYASDLYKFEIGKMQGNIPANPPPLNNVKLWDLLNSYLNGLMNEIYPCYKEDSSGFYVVPTVVAREKPFSSVKGHKGERGFNVFTSLPTWTIDPSLVYQYNFSRNENLRFNVVHIIGLTGNNDVDAAKIALQNSAHVMQADEQDIALNGVRPYTATTNFEVIGGGLVYTPRWNKVVFDWVHNGHLKVNGTLSCAGIEENITVGDNLQVGSTIFHIESINHTGVIDGMGRVQFRTNLVLTNGVDEKSKLGPNVYPDMKFFDTYDDRINDKTGFANGYSDFQDTELKSADLKSQLKSKLNLGVLNKNNLKIKK